MLSVRHEDTHHAQYVLRRDNRPGRLNQNSSLHQGTSRAEHERNPHLMPDDSRTRQDFDFMSGIH